MSSEISKAKAINIASSLNTQNILTSGRNIKSLRLLSSLESDYTSKQKLNYKIIKSVQKHYILINNLAKNRLTPNKSLNVIIGSKLNDLAHSNLAVSDGNYSLVNVEALANKKLTDKFVLLKKPNILDLPIQSGNYKFYTKIVLGIKNIVGYSNYGYEFTNIKVNTKINKLDSNIIKLINKQNYTNTQIN